MELLQLLEKGLWFGLASLGFAILFNVPNRTLISIFILAALGGLCKIVAMRFGINVIVASFLGATLIGFLSIPFAHTIHAPPPTFAIPAVIPMVPGIYAYQMMLGLIKLSGTLNPDTYTLILSETINNGLKVMLILISLAGGVGVPMLLTRKESAKNMRLRKKRKSIS